MALTELTLQEPVKQFHKGFPSSIKIKKKYIFFLCLKLTANVIHLNFRNDLSASYF